MSSVNVLSSTRWSVSNAVNWLTAESTGSILLTLRHLMLLAFGTSSRKGTTSDEVESEMFSDVRCGKWRMKSRALGPERGPAS